MPGVTYEDDDKYKPKPEECCIEGSELCHWMGGKENCERCYISSYKHDEEREKARDHWRVMLSNLPDGIDSLHKSDTCVLCKDTARPRECYGSIDMAHPEPKAMKGIIFGFGKKVRIPVGSMFTLHLSSCTRCRRVFRMADMLQILIFVAMLAAGFVLVALPGVGERIAGAFILMPIIVVALAGIAGYLLGRGISSWYRTKMSGKVHLDVTEIPLIRQMVDKGWFYIDDIHMQKPAKLFFTTKKTVRNIFPPQEEKLDSEPLE